MNSKSLFKREYFCPTIELMTEYVMYVKQASQTFHNVTLVQKAHLMMILQMKHNVFHVNATLMVQ